jgi:hypothetical protein
MNAAIDEAISYDFGIFRPASSRLALCQPASIQASKFVHSGSPTKKRHDIPIEVLL